MTAGPDSRHLYLRLMSRSEVTNHEGELELVRGIVASAPGVERVKEIRPHIKGRVAVFLDVRSVSIGDVSDHISGHGYMLVL
jgi:hypothetical protein